MASYKIVFMPSAVKDFRGIPKNDRNRIIKRIDALALNPRPHGCKQLINRDEYRIRQGDYRIIYTIQDTELVVWVIKIGHRKDIYRVSEEKGEYSAEKKKSKKP